MQVLHAREPDELGRDGTRKVVVIERQPLHAGEVTEYGRDRAREIVVDERQFRNPASSGRLHPVPLPERSVGQPVLAVVPVGPVRRLVQRLVIRGRRRDFGLGSAALVSLAEAREKARANRKLAREGGDPLAERRRVRNMLSFAEAAERVVEQKRSGWRNPRQALDWMASLRRYAFPRIGRMPVSEVTSGDVLEILAPIWHVKAPTARVLRQRIRTVLEWAVAMEYRPRTTQPTVSGRSWDRRTQWCGTCGRCRIARWLRRSRRCGPRTRCLSPSSHSSFSS